MPAVRNAFRRSLAPFYDGYDADIGTLMGASGKVFYVCNRTGGGGANDTNHGTFNAPFSTIDYAIGACVAGRGDVIVVKVGHVETISAAGGIACDVSDITIIGMGAGDQRPLVNIGTATSASITVSAANVTWRNMRILSTFADVVAAFVVTSTGFGLMDCDIGDSAVNLNFLSAVKCTSTTDGNANGIRLLRNLFLSQDAATLGFVIFSADVLKATIEDNIIVSEGTGLATIFTCLTGKDIRMCSVQRNYLSSKATSGNLAWSNDTASPNNSGIIAENRIRHADVTGAHALGAVGGCGFFNNLSASTDAVSGFVLPAIDVDL